MYLPFIRREFWRDSKRKTTVSLKARTVFDSSLLQPIQRSAHPRSVLDAWFWDEFKRVGIFLKKTPAFYMAMPEKLRDPFIATLCQVSFQKEKTDWIHRTLSHTRTCFLAPVPRVWRILKLSRGAFQMLHAL